LVFNFSIFHCFRTKTGINKSGSLKKSVGKKGWEEQVDEEKGVKDL